MFDDQEPTDIWLTGEPYAANTRRRSAQPTIVGIGLVALDVIVDRGEITPALHAGGTCANVLAILSYLAGERSQSQGSETIRRPTLSARTCELGESTAWASLKPSARTPIIVEKLRADRNGIPFHTFSFFCPACGARFPGFQPVTGQAAAPLVTGVSGPDVFFVDRVSKSAVALAEAFRTTKRLSSLNRSEPTNPDCFND